MQKSRVTGMITFLFLLAITIISTPTTPMSVASETSLSAPEGDYPLPECRRWAAQISCEEVFRIRGGSCSRAQNTSTEFYKALYHDTAKAACKKTAEFGNHPGVIDAVITPRIPNHASCTENGVTWTSVTNEPVPPEELCSYKVEGPYKNFADFPFTTDPLAPNSNASQTYYGAEWKNEQRVRIRDHNRRLNDIVRGSTKLISDINKPKSKYENKPEWAPIPDYFSRKGLTEELGKPNTGQIHHIIPLIDRKGCKCGTNSYKNAVVISEKLNSEMSNDTTHPILKKIVERYRVF